MSASIFKHDFQMYDPQPIPCAIGAQGSCLLFFQVKHGWASVTDWSVQDPNDSPALFAKAGQCAETRNAGHLRIITPANHPHVAAARQLPGKHWETVSLGAPTASLKPLDDSKCSLIPRQIEEAELRARARDIAALICRALDPEVAALDGKTVEDYTLQLLDYDDRDAVWIAQDGSDIVGFGMTTKPIAIQAGNGSAQRGCLSRFMNAETSPDMTSSATIAAAQIVPAITQLMICVCSVPSRARTCGFWKFSF